MKTRVDLVNLTGKRFGKLVVQKYLGSNQSIWLCRCDCGMIRKAKAHSLKIGATTSCGCAGKKHGHARAGNETKTYGIWSAMKRRCYNTHTKAYPEYGGRGIKVCNRWHEYKNFLADMGEAPKGLTIERRNNDGDYTPENCYWASMKQQCRNRRSNIVIEYNGERMVLIDWATKTGIEDSTLRRRIALGWTIEKAFTTPVSPVAKLDEEKIAEIRKLLKDNVTPKDIAAKFSVSRGTIYSIRAGRGWTR